MSRFQVVNPADASGKTKDLLDQVNRAMGLVPNMTKVMANAPAVLQAYLGMSSALAGGQLSAKLRQKLALITAQDNGCGYCLSAHSAISKNLGMSDAELISARQGMASDAKQQAALVFADRVIQARGQVEDRDLQAVREAGFSEAEILEIIGAVVLNIFTNYVNIIAQTEIDFPVVETTLAL